MNFFREKAKDSPIYARFAPFFIFVGLMALSFSWKGDGKFWLYLIRTLVGAWLIFQMRPFVPEMRWAFSWEAIVVGVVVFVAWVGLDPFYPPNHLLFKPTPDDVWNPFARFGQGSAPAWALCVVRIAGMTLVVPPLEEVFYRSFLYRYFVRINFLEMPLNRFHPTSFIVMSMLFGLEHYQWLAGILCGFAYQGLVVWKNRLGDAMTAHAITNFLLGVYVLWKGAWNFF